MGAVSENDEVSAFVGTTLAGKYRVDGIIGVGGMGFVLAATHLHIDEPVAVKLLFSALGSKPEIVQRFMREAKAARKIRSEHVVRVLDVDTLENGTPYIVMEHLQGQDLEAVIRRQGRQPIATALDVLLQAMEALAEAHVQKMVHRDLKPANIFVSKRPDGDALVKVLDFGISKVTGTGGADLNVTQAGDSILGSPQYMAPEQLKSLKDVDARTDIWALGSMLYEMLTAQPPFNAPSLPELCVAILDRDPPSLREIRPDVPTELEAIILSCLAKEPEGRPDNVSALASLLAPFCPPVVQASVGRILGVFRTARFAREGGGTFAMNAASPAQIAAAKAAAAGMPSPSPSPVSTGNPLSSQKTSSSQHPPRSVPPPQAPTRVSSPPAAQPPRSVPPPGHITLASAQSPVGNKTTGNAFSKSSSGQPLAPPRNQAGIAAAVLGGAAILIALVVVFVAIPWARARNGQTPAATVSAVTPPPLVSETVPTPPVSATATASDEPALPEAPDAAVSTTASATASASASAPTVTTPSVKPLPQIDCSPPYVVDADGIKRWKRGCIGR